MSILDHELDARTMEIVAGELSASRIESQRLSDLISRLREENRQLKESIEKPVYHKYRIVVETKDIYGRYFHLVYKAIAKSPEAAENALFEEYNLPEMRDMRIHRVRVICDDTDENTDVRALVIYDFTAEVSGLTEIEKVTV